MPTNITPRDLRTREPINFFVNVTTYDGELVEQIPVRESEVYQSFAWLTAEIKEAMAGHINRTPG